MIKDLIAALRKCGQVCGDGGDSYGQALTRDAADRIEELENEVRLAKAHPYSVSLAEMAPGVPFMMCNYKGIYVRVAAGPDLFTTRRGPFQTDTYQFDDDGHHVPIVELTTGHLFYMAKVKPCFIYPGEDHTRKS